MANDVQGKNIKEASMRKMFSSALKLDMLLTSYTIVGHNKEICHDLETNSQLTLGKFVYRSLPIAASCFHDDTLYKYAS